MRHSCSIRLYSYIRSAIQLSRYHCSLINDPHKMETKQSHLLMHPVRNERCSDSLTDNNTSMHNCQETTTFHVDNKPVVYSIYSVPARHIYEGAAPCPYCIAPCPNSLTPCPNSLMPCPIYIAPCPNNKIIIHFFLHIQYTVIAVFVFSDSL